MKADGKARGGYRSIKTALLSSSPQRFTGFMSVRAGGSRRPSSQVLGSLRGQESDLEIGYLLWWR